MIDILIITDGKKHDPDFAVKIADYEKRLRGQLKLSWQIIPSSEKPNESAKILEKIDKDDYVILLDERGILVSNAQLVQAFEIMAQQAKKLVIIIGGSYGVDQSVFNRSNQVVALSGLVLPHQLVRLIVVEQIYRTTTILNNQNYHH